MSFVWSSQDFNCHMHLNFPPKLSKNEKNVAISYTTSSHCSRMADSVQWFSQSDYRICISIPVEIY